MQRQQILTPIHLLRQSTINENLLIVVECRMIIPTIKPFPPSPNHLIQIQHDQIIKNLAMFVRPPTDIQQISHQDHGSAGTSFGGRTTGVKLRPCVVSGVEGVDIVRVGSCVSFTAVDYDDVVSPEGGTVAAAFCRWRRAVWQRGDLGPNKGFQIETIYAIIDWMLEGNLWKGTIVGVAIEATWYVSSDQRSAAVPKQ
jgi:hypothetical protein